MTKNTSTSDDIRVITNDQEDDDLSLDTLIDQLGPCARPYWNLDQCLDETNHNWLTCKDKVAQLKACWEDLEKKGLRQVQKDREMITKLKVLKQQHNKSDDNNNKNNDKQ